MLICYRSLTGSKKAASWQQYIGEDGHVFYVELTHAYHSQTISARKTDASSVCSLCSTRSCHSCASEDTGYSSDTDTHSTQSKNKKSEQLVLDLSHESLSSHSKVADLEDDDDGVSVDLLDFERSEQMRTKFERQCDFGDLCERLTLECDVGKSRLHHGRHRALGCTRTSSLCERHSNKLCVPENRFSKSALTSEHHQTCKCVGQSALMSHSKRKLCDARKEIILHLRPSGHVWDGRSKISWLESVLGIVPGHAVSSNSLDKRKDSADADCEKVVIKGLTPDGAAIKNKELLIGKYQLAYFKEKCNY